MTGVDIGRLAEQAQLSCPRQDDELSPPTGARAPTHVEASLGAFADEGSIPSASMETFSNQ